MLLALLAFLGGALTILSPCILPVLPFVFARSDRAYARSTLPLLAGMAVTFAGIATLAAVGGAWAVRINSYGRIAALVLLAAFGLALLSRRVADFIARPFVAFGNRLLAGGAGSADPSITQSALLGVATGLLWAPCAGPILGLILTGAAINGPNAQTSLLLFAYAAGAVASLAIATLIGGKVFAALKRSLGAGEWVRRALGAAVLAGVAAIALGWDTGVLTNLSAERTNRVEQWLLAKVSPDDAPDAGAAMMSADRNEAGGDAMASGDMMMSANPEGDAVSGGAMMAAKQSAGAAGIEGDMPELAGVTAWLNSKPLTRESLRGKVVVIDFWTYSCINCLRALPYINAWYQHYKDSGLVIIGVHSPEFAFEKDTDNVTGAIAKFGIQYPVALDNDFAVWKAFNNRFWPAHYFIDAEGKIRGHHFGEGKYERSERTIRKLLTEAGAKDLPDPIDDAAGEGVSAAADLSNVASPETYLGFERAENFSSPGPVARNAVKEYQVPGALTLNQWALGGRWNVTGEKAQLDTAPGRVVFRFKARDLHLVLGPGATHKPVRFRVTLDGKPPGAHHGMDIDANGNGTVREQRLYQLIRQSGAVAEHEFSIEFLDAHVEAYSFTFG